jgi:uncharacterized protein (DUF1778 family)
MATKKLFKAVPDEDRKDVSMLVRMTKSDADQIRHSAKIRQLSVADFIRRAALGRKADVDYETEIVLVLIDITRAIRALHKAMVERGFPPPEDLLLPIIVGAGDAISRISK